MIQNEERQLSQSRSPALFRALPIDEIDDRWQSMAINRLILVIDEQSIVQSFVIIDCHRLSIAIDNR